MCYSLSRIKLLRYKGDSLSPFQELREKKQLIDCMEVATDSGRRKDLLGLPLK